MAQLHFLSDHPRLTFSDASDFLYLSPFLSGGAA